MKKTLFLFFCFFVLLLIGVYAFTQLKSTTQDTSQIVSTKTFPSPSKTIRAWLTYTSDQYDFSMEYPLDVKVEPTQEGIHFLKLGPSQSMGTELFDGMSLLIFSGSFSEKSFEEFVQSEYKKEKNEPTTETISQLRKATVRNTPGFGYTITSLGTRTVTYLPRDNNRYIKITDNTVQPANAKRDFHEIANDMLDTLEL